jgi:hypothetical protein
MERSRLPKKVTRVFALGAVVVASIAYAQAGTKVGNGWDCQHYIAADFTGDGKSDMICHTSNGDMQLFPFVNNTFYNGGGPIKAGNGWNFSQYWTGDWTGDGVSDLLIIDQKGDLLLFPMKDNTFYAGGGPIKVGNGWPVRCQCMASDFNGDGKPDMIMRTPEGDMKFYPWNGKSFY